MPKTKGSVSFCKVKCVALKHFPDDMDVIVSMKQAKQLGVEYEPIYSTAKNIKATAPVVIKETESADVAEVTE